MNHFYRLSWSQATSQWVPVPERATARGVQGAQRAPRTRRLGQRIVMLSLLAASLGMTGLAYANGGGPSGGQIVVGSGHIQQSGNTTTITQSSQNLALNWQSFNIGANQTVDFVQPNSSSIAINRIFSNSPSEILGHLDANGQVWLINPNGVLFGQGSQVDVGGLIASSLDLDNSTFASGDPSFRGTGKGSVINQGSITAAPGGYVALIGNQVSNQGSIRAQLGTVALGGGSAVTLTFAGDQLVHLQVDQSTLNNLAENKQLIVADGGRVIMTAGAKNALLASVVNNTGVVQAQTVENHNGTITLLGGMQAGQVNVGGTLDASAPNGGSGGSIETSAANFNLAANAHINASATGGKAGTWLVDPTNLTIDTAAANTISSTLNGGTNVTETTTATGATGVGTQTAGAGDIDVDAAVTWTNAAASLTLSAYNAINVNAPITGAGGLTLNTTHTGATGAGITIDAAVNTTGSVLMNSVDGNMTIGAAGSIVGGGGVTLGTTSNFVNNGGATAVSTGTTSPWLIYSTNPTLDTAGGLAPNFIQYNAPFQKAVLGTGNGFLYSLAPTVRVTALTGTVVKSYDGTTAASLTPANLTTTGLINGNKIATVVGGTYASANAATGISVSLPAAIGNYTFTDATGAIPVYGYTLTGGTVSANIGTINKAQLTATVIGDPTKVYNGTTTAALSAANYSFLGFAAGQGMTVGQPSSVAYANSSAGPEAVNVTFTSTNFTANAGTNFANYILPTTGTGMGTINPAPLQIGGLLATNKVYDGTTLDTLNTSNASLFGVITADAGQVTLNSAGAVGNFGSPNVGNGLAVNVDPSSFTLSGAKASDYILIAPSGLTANITPAMLTIAGVTASNKVYDGTALDPLNTTGATLSGVVPADAGNITLSGTATGMFSQSNVGNGLAVSITGFGLTGANASNYILSQPSGLTANITPATLNVVFSGDPTKIYDATNAATLTTGDFTVSGFVAGQSAVVSQSPATYAQANAGTNIPVTATLEASDFTPASDTLLSNYTFPASVSGTGTISPAVLTGSIVGNPTKVFDGTTAATLTAGNYTLTGFVPGQSISLTTLPTDAAYASPNAGVEAVSATAAPGDFTAGGGTLLSNYVLPASFTGFGTITPKALTVGLSAAISGNPTKVYDGTNIAMIPAGDFVLSGFMGTDAATINQTITGAYASKNVGSQPISASLAEADFTFSSGDASNYTFPVAAFGTGTITPALLSVAIINNPTKVYDGSTTAHLDSSQFGITGFVSGEGATINPTATFDYVSANAGTGIMIGGTLTSNNYVPSANTLMSNYTIDTTATGPGTITPAPLFITGVFATNKVYNTTTSDSLNISGAGLSGLVGSDTGDVTLNPGTTGTFSQSNVGNGLSVTANGFSISGSASSNYTLQPITGLTANITPAPLTISGVTANNKFYDGTTADTLNTGAAALVGVFGGDTVTLSSAAATGMFASANAGNNLAVAASGFSIGGAQVGNYMLTQPGSLTASIMRAILTATIIGNPTKAYDGSASATLIAADYSLTGFAAGQGATIPQSANASYVSANAGTNVGVQSTLAVSDFKANAGTNLANYVLPTDATGVGAITPYVLNLTGTRVYNTFTDAAGNLFGTLAGLNGDSFTVSGSGITSSKNVGTYTGANFNLGTLQLVTAGTGVTGNYTLIGGTDVFTITKATLIASATAMGKVYNGTTVATLGNQSFTGLLGTDQVALTNDTTGTFSSKDVGTRTVSTNFGISGADAGNYNIVQPTGLSATITPLTINILATGVSKVYDGTNTDAATLSLNPATPLAPGDTLTYTDTSALFTSANVGSWNVNVSGIKANGAAATAGDYIYNTTAVTSANITPRPIVLNSTRVYDGSTDANASLFGGGTVNGIAGQTLTLSGSGVLNSKDTGTQGFQSLGTLQLGNGTGGGLASNYTLSPFTSDSVLITPIVFNLTGTRVYDAMTDADGNLFGTLTGIGGDSFTVSGSGITSSKNVGTYTGANFNLGTLGLVANGSANASDYTLIGGVDTFTITPLAISVAAAAANKTYDSTDAASVKLSSSGVLAGDTVTFADGSATFATPNAGNGITVTASGITDGGADAGNYTLLNTTATTTADITPKLITLNSTRPYDGSTGADASLFTTGGTIATGIGGQTLSLSGSGVLDSKNVGTQNFSGIGTLALGNGGNGGLSSNYTLGDGTGDSVIITPLDITVSISALNKVYDGTDAASVTLMGNGVIAGDDVNFADTSANFASPNAANGITVTANGISDSGADASNYHLVNTTATTTANITPLPIVLQSQRVYDATTGADASLFTTGGTLNGILGQTLTLSGSGVLTTKNVGSEQPFQSLGSLALGDGTGMASNYTLSPISNDWVTITPLMITVSATGTNKTYDGNTTAMVGLSSTGVLQGDTVNFTDSSANFASPNAGTGVSIAVNGISGSGADAGNYVFNNTATTSANITPAIINLTGTRTYNGTTDAAASLFGNNGVVMGVNGETLDLSGTGTLVTKNVGTALPFASLGSLNLNDGTGLASNYTLVGGVDQVTITPAILTVVGTMTTNRLYDGTTLDALSGSMLSGLFGNDSVNLGNDTVGNFASKNVGNGKAVSTNMTIDGSDASNYILVQPTGLTANVTPRPVTVAAKGSNRFFNNNSLDSVTLSGTGVLPGDQVGFTDTTADFNNPYVGDNKTVTVSGISTTGADAENYVVTDPTTTTTADVFGVNSAAFGVPTGTIAQLQSNVDPNPLETPYGSADMDAVGVYTGNQKKQHRPIERNRIRSDFHSGLPLRVQDGGVRLPTDASP